MKTEQIRELAIKRHDIDAEFFQNTYADKIKNVKKVYPFRYGRQFILEDLKMILDTLPKGAKILDIGSGTGHLTHWISSMGFEISGIEPSREMIGFARKNFPELTFKEGISSKLPFEDGSFDLVVAFEVLRYLDKTENINTYNEVRRVLKNDGKFFFTQVNKYATDFYFPFYYIKKIVYSIKNKVYHFCFFTTSSSQKRLLKNCGYKKVETIGRMSASVRLAYKFGKKAGDLYVKMIEKIFGRQRFTKWPMKSLAGHLIVIGTK